MDRYGDVSQPPKGSIQKRRESVKYNFTVYISINYFEQVTECKQPISVIHCIASNALRG